VCESTRTAPREHSPSGVTEKAQTDDGTVCPPSSVQLSPVRGAGT
jgi:hypothetical protein